MLKCSIWGNWGLLTPGSSLRQNTEKKSLFPPKMKLKTMPRNPPPFLTALQSPGLPSGQLSGFSLPGVCAYSLHCHRLATASHTRGPVQLATATASRAGAPFTGPVTLLSGHAVSRSYLVLQVLWPAQPCTDPRGREGASLWPPSVLVSWPKVLCALEGFSYPASPILFPG